MRKKVVKVLMLLRGKRVEVEEGEIVVEVEGNQSRKSLSYQNPEEEIERKQLAMEK